MGLSGCMLTPMKLRSIKRKLKDTARESNKSSRYTIRAIIRVIIRVIVVKGEVNYAIDLRKGNSSNINNERVIF